MPVDDWKILGHHIVTELERQARCVEEMRNSQTEIFKQLEIEIATLKVKSSLWGAAGGLLAALAAVLLAQAKQ